MGVERENKSDCLTVQAELCHHCDTGCKTVRDLALNTACYSFMREITIIV